MNFLNYNFELLYPFCQKKTQAFTSFLYPKKATSGDTEADQKPAQKRAGDVAHVEQKSGARKSSLSTAISSSASSSISEKGDVTDAKTDNNDATQVE